MQREKLKDIWEEAKLGKILNTFWNYNILKCMYKHTHAYILHIHFPTNPAPTNLSFSSISSHFLARNQVNIVFALHSLWQNYKWWTDDLRGFTWTVSVSLFCWFYYSLLKHRLKQQLVILQCYFLINTFLITQSLAHLIKWIFTLNSWTKEMCQHQWQGCSLDDTSKSVLWYRLIFPGTLNISHLIKHVG